MLGLVVSAQGTQAATKTTKKRVATTKKPVATTPAATAAPATVAPATTAGPAAAAAAAPVCKDITPIRLANFGQAASTMILDYALITGLFEKYCVKVTLNPAIFNATLIVQSVDSGQADIALTGITGVVTAIAAKRDVIVVANSTVGFPLEFELGQKAAARLAAHGVTAKSPLKTKLDWLKGLTFSAPAVGSSTDTVFRYLLKSNGLSPDKDVTLRGLPDAASIAAALRNDTVDGMANVTSTLTVQSQLEGWGVFYMNAGREDPVLKQLAPYVLATSNSYIKNKPDVLKGFLQAWSESRKILATGNGYPADVIAKLKPIEAPDMAQSVWEAFFKDTRQVLLGGDMMPTEAEGKVAVEVTNSSLDTPTSLTFNQLYNTSIISQIK